MMEPRARVQWVYPAETDCRLTDVTAVHCSLRRSSCAAQPATASMAQSNRPPPLPDHLFKEDDDEDLFVSAIEVGQLPASPERDSCRDFAEQHVQTRHLGAE